MIAYEATEPTQANVAVATNVMSAAPDMPGSYTMAAPLNETELTMLLMQSPLYQKLEEIKKTVAKGGFGGRKMVPGQGYLDARDADWTNDTELCPVDLNKLNPRSFIVYKFGSFITDLVTGHCQHMPVTLLLADKIPPNTELAHNAYRNSFQYDANNHILYMRTARLDSVGEFVLVLVHTLAHIKSGKLFLSIPSSNVPSCHVVSLPLSFW
jgi:hypothetical protein